MRIRWYLLGLALLICSFTLVVQATESTAQGDDMLYFAAGTRFFNASNGFSAANNGGTVSMTAYYLGSGKEAANAEVAVILKGQGDGGLVKADESITITKVTSNNKAIKVSLDKKNNQAIKLSATGLGRGTITVSGVARDGKSTTTYTAILPFIVMPPVYEAIEVEIKAKTEPKLDTQRSPLASGGSINALSISRSVYAGETLSAAVRFFSTNLGLYSYGGAKANGVWQSLDPGYIQVSNDGKMKALTPTDAGQTARAVFIDYLGMEKLSLVLTILPKSNAKVENWANRLCIEYNSLADKKNKEILSRQSDGNLSPLTWSLSKGPLQLNAVLKERPGDRTEKGIKTSVYYYSTQPAYAAIDNKGICYPLQETRVNGVTGVTLEVYVVGRDFLGPKMQQRFFLTIEP